MVQIRAANGHTEGTCHAFLANVLTCADVPVGPSVLATGLGFSLRSTHSVTYFILRADGNYTHRSQQRSNLFA